MELLRPERLTMNCMNRREFGKRLALTGAAWSAATRGVSAGGKKLELRYIVASSMYGELPLGEILPDVRKTGAEWIDIWPRNHGNQREQMEAMGHEAFRTQLTQHQVKLGCLTHYDLGPFRLQAEMKVAGTFKCPLMICGGSGPKGLKGAALKTAVREFTEKTKPHLAVAEENHVSIAIENHANNLIDSPDSLKWLAEMVPSKNLGIALAPYHLPQDTTLLADLIRALGDRLLMFYAWQHGMGCTKKLPKEQELLQMPGRGELSFQPLVEALRQIEYRGFTEIFMHPVPRGIPILPTAQEVTQEVNRSRRYLESFL